MHIRHYSDKFGKFSILLLLLISACTAGGATEAPPTEAPPTEVPSIKVGMLFPGSTTDAGFSQAGFFGLQRAEEELGVETFIRESVEVPDQQEAFRDLAAQDLDLIIGFGSFTQDAALEVASEFPDIQFVIIFGTVTAENVAAMRLDQVAASFLAGVFAGLTTETGQVAWLAGIQFPSSLQAEVGFKAGVEYVNPDVTVTAAYSGNMFDVAAAKEATLAAVDAGADIIYFMYNEGTPGVFAAAEEREFALLNNASRFGECEANENYVASTIAAVPPVVFAAVESFVNGTLDASGTSIVGLANSDAIGFEICPAGDASLASQIDEVKAAIISGEIDLPE